MLSVMYRVGRHLQIEALSLTGEERDVFARSAYNRYYYSVFLLVREMFSSIDPSWSRLAHRDYPSTIRGKIIKKYKGERKLANKNSDYELISLLEKAISASNNLASLMEKAYVTRVVADYEPNEKVSFSSADRYSLKKIEITHADAWTEQSRLWIQTMKQAWSQINV